MTLRRLGSSLVFGLAAGLGVAWLISQALPSNAPRAGQLLSGVPYSVEVSAEKFELDLSFDSGARYLLVVGSLGSATRSFTATLDAHNIEEVSLFPARPIEPMRAQRSTGSAKPSSPGPTENQTVTCSLPATRVTHTAGFAAHPAQTHAEQAIPPSTSRRDPPAEKSFFLHVTDGSLDDRNQYAEVAGRLVGHGENVRVYLDRQISEKQLAPGFVEEIVRLFDSEIIPDTARHLGHYRDVDGDRGFTVLLSPWLDRLQGGRTSLGGFARGSDFRVDIPAPFSNHCDMLYLNANLCPGAHLKPLLAHEYAHAVCFSERLPHARNLDGLPDEEDWLNEAIAHCAENMCAAGWSNIDYRVSRYLNAPSRYPLVVPDYYRAGLWRDHGCRGATYLFLRWCVDQFGEDLLQKIVRSPKRGIDGLELATGRRFDDLFRRWNLALIQPQVGPPESTKRRACSERGCSPAPDGYNSVDVYGQLASWGLAGPRVETWNVDAGARQFELKGTSTAFFELQAAQLGGVRRVRLHAKPGAGMQVSIVKLPADHPCLEANACWCQPGPSPKILDPLSKSASANQSVRIDISADRRTALTIESVSCEWNSGETKQSHCFTRNELSAFEDILPTPSRGDLPGTRLCYRLPVKDSRDAEEGLVIKISARDARGRPVCTWATVPSRGELQMQARAEAEQTTITR